jgi:hypothetical protein
MMGGGMRSSGPGTAGPGSSGDSSEPGAVTADEGPKNFVFEPAHFNAILAIVPFEKEFDQYRHVLETAALYDPGRDRPRYLAYVIERAEVSADPNAELAWEKIGGTASWKKIMKGWAGRGTEVIDEAYIEPALTMPIPPILLRDAKAFATHPKIPLKSQRAMTTTAQPSAVATEEETTGDVPSDIPSGPLPGAGGNQMAGGSSPGSGSRSMDSRSMMGGGMRSGMQGAMGGSGGMSSGGMTN